MRFLRNTKLLNTFRMKNFPRNANISNIIVTDKSDLVKRTNFKAGDAAPYAYNDILEYPEDYDPWRFNYSGSGILIGGLLILGYANWAYEREYLAIVGRDSRPPKKYYQP